MKGMVVNMITGYLGMDIGSISTKGVIIDDNNKIIAAKYIWTEGNPINAVKDIIKALKEQVSDIKVTAVGTTGSARKLIGTMLGADVVKNEITAHAIGTLSVFPTVRTIFEIGGQDSKIILIENGIVIDYAMNTLCAAGTGSFLTSQAKRLGIDVEDFGKIALTSKKPTKIAARCTVFAESDLVHKAQIGHQKEDIIAGLCMAVVTNYLNNIGKGKSIKAPIVFQGGVSKNIGVIKAFEEVTKEKILVDTNSHLMGALGVAILAKKYKNDKSFDFDVTDISFETKGYECKKCPNNCEIICFYKDNALIDAWGNRCENGDVVELSMKNKK
jgi:predicted CoA-substrate-specific enzyme activase